MYESVLVVEDDATLRRVLAAALRRRGVSVSEAASVTEAIGGLRAATPDLLLVDVNLPDGSGWDVARAARELAGTVPTVAMSAAPVSREELREHDLVGFLAKPFSIDALLSLLDGDGTPGAGLGAPWPSPSTHPAADLPQCVLHLRAAAAALRDASPGDLTAVSVLAPLTARPGELRIVRALAEELADVHGLDVGFSTRAGGALVRFVRRADTHDPAPERVRAPRRSAPTEEDPPAGRRRRTDGEDRRFALRASIVQIRACAQTLAAMPELGSVSVGGALADGPEEARLLRAVASAVAEQHGLSCSVRADGALLTFRFGHEGAPTAPARTGWSGGWVRRVLRWCRAAAAAAGRRDG